MFFRPLRTLKYLYCTAITPDIKLSMKNYFKQVIINEKYEKAWSKIADSTPSGKFDRIWEFSCKPLEFFPKKFKDPTDHKESTKNKDDSNDEFTEEDMENEESEYDSNADSEESLCHRILNMNRKQIMNQILIQTARNSRTTLQIKLDCFYALLFVLLPEIFQAGMYRVVGSRGAVAPQIFLHCRSSEP